VHGSQPQRHRSTGVVDRDASFPNYPECRGTKPYSRFGGSFTRIANRACTLTGKRWLSPQVILLVPTNIGIALRDTRLQRVDENTDVGRQAAMAQINGVDCDRSTRGARP